MKYLLYISAPVPGNMFAYAGSCYNVREDASKTWDEAKVIVKLNKMNDKSETLI